MKLYECPLCGRRGFSRLGLTRHYCPATEGEVPLSLAPLWQRRRRLRAEELARARPVPEREGP